VSGEVTIDQMIEHQTTKRFRGAACIAIGAYAGLDRVAGGRSK